MLGEKVFMDKSIDKKSYAKNQQSFNNIRQFGLIFILVLLCLVMSALSKQFMTASNLLNVARQVSVTAITAVGMTMVIIIGGIDLSVGSIVAFTGVISASVFSATDSIITALAVGLLAGLIIGFLNGFVTAWCGIAGFITTLSTMSIIRGIGFIYTGGYPIAVADKRFTLLGTGYVGPIPVPIIIMLIILVLGYFVTTQTRFGRYIYALGGNEQAARWSGVNVNYVKIGVYTLSGFFAAISGIILAGRLASGQPNAGQGFEMDVIAGAIVGGTSLAGGKGSIIGTFIGVLLIGILSNGLTLLNVSTYYQMVVKGIIILVAVIIDTLSRKAS